MRLDSHWEIHAVRHSRLTPLPRPTGPYSSSATARTETGWCFLQSGGDPFVGIRLAVTLPSQEADVSSCLCLPTTHMRLSSHQCEDPRSHTDPHRALCELPHTHPRHSHQLSECNQPCLMCMLLASELTVSM